MSVPASCPFLSQTSSDRVILALHSGLSLRLFLRGKSRRAAGQHAGQWWGLRRTCITRNCQGRGRGKMAFLPTRTTPQPPVHGPPANHWVLPHIASRACWLRAEWWEAAGVPHHSYYGQVFWGPGHAGCFVCWCVRKGSQGLAACLQHGAVWSTAVLLGQSCVPRLQVGKLCIQGRASGPVVGKSLPVLHGDLGGRGGKLEGVEERLVGDPQTPSSAPWPPCCL